VVISQRDLETESAPRSTGPAVATQSLPGSLLAVRSASGWSFFRLDEIEWVEVVGSTLRIHDVTGRIARLRAAPDACARLLKDDRFVRVGRAKMVNEEHVRAIECVRRGTFVVVLASGQRLSITREARRLLAGPACSRRGST